METTETVAFVGHRHLGTGPLSTLLASALAHRDSPQPLLFFEKATGRQVDFDLRGSLDEVLARLTPAPARPGPGRPKLGVRSAEVTLLPRHWEWLDAQPARASGTLRRLVEEAMAREAADPRRRREALGRILWALAGNEVGFEEACRALYAGDLARLNALTAPWSGDLPAFIRGWD